MTDHGQRYCVFVPSILDHPIVGSRKPYTVHDAWEWLLFEAAWKARTYRAGSIVVQLQRGQLAHSTRYMAKAWGWSEARVRRFLKRLKTDAMIDAATDAGVTVITICNYERYQLGGRNTDAASDAATDAKVTQQRRRKEESKKDKKESGEPDGFAAWYEAYPKHVDRRAAAKAYRAALGRDDCSIESLLAAAQRYALEKQGSSFIKHPATWLNASSYLNEAAPTSNSGGFKIETPTPRDPKTFTETEWRDRLGIFKSQGKWPDKAWGPSPGSPGCLVPPHLIVGAA